MQLAKLTSPITNIASVIAGRLQALAENLLREHGNEFKASKALAKVLKTNDELLQYLALRYLYELDIKPEAPVVRIPVKAHNRGPSTAARQAALKVAQKAAETVLDSFKIRDGRAIGDVSWGELERLHAANTKEANVIRALLNHAQADSSAYVRDVVRASDLERMIKNA
jgi:hypothetical protein